MTEVAFWDLVASNHRTTFWRLGQNMFNSLAVLDPDLAALIRSSKLDPYYMDDRIPEFLDQVFHQHVKSTSEQQGERMTARQYVNETKAMSRPNMGLNDSLLLYAIGGAGEMGEVCEIIKKHLWHDKPMVIDDLLKEVGDVLWYLARLLDTASLGQFDLGDAMELNIAKLRDRHPNGWHTEYSSDPGGDLTARADTKSVHSV